MGAARRFDVGGQESRSGTSTVSFSRRPPPPREGSSTTTHKSMVCAYSLRAKRRPTISTPLKWRKLEDALERADGSLLVFEMGDVLERVDEHGDPFEGVLTTRQRLAAPAGQTLAGA
jgi:hypothetical protein